jgi:hypothetical protein
MAKLSKTLKNKYGAAFSEEAISAIISRVSIMHNGTRTVDPSDTADQYLLLKNTAYETTLPKSHDCPPFEFAFQVYLMRRGRRINL